MFLTKRYNGIYYIHFINEYGKRNKVSCKTTSKPEALKFLSQFETELLRRKNEKFQSIRLKEYFSQFLERNRFILSAETIKNYEAFFNMLINFLGNKYTGELSPKDLEDFILSKKELKPQSIKEYYFMLKHFISLLKKDGVISKNFELKEFRIKVPERPPIYFTAEMIKQLLNNIRSQDFKDIILFAFLTGLRRGGLVNQKWNDIDFEKRSITIGSGEFTTKNKKFRVIPIVEDVFKILTRRFAIKVNDFVFTHKGKKWVLKYIDQKFKAECRKVFGEDTELCFHSLRHSFASALVMQGVNLYSVSKLLGHSSVKMTERYSHLQPESLRNEVEKIRINLN